MDPFQTEDSFDDLLSEPTVLDPSLGRVQAKTGKAELAADKVSWQRTKFCAESRGSCLSEAYSHRNAKAPWGRSPGAVSRLPTRLRRRFRVARRPFRPASIFRLSSVVPGAVSPLTTRPFDSCGSA